jgi:hypothetical protein
MKLYITTSSCMPEMPLESIFNYPHSGIQTSLSRSSAARYTADLRIVFVFLAAERGSSMRIIRLSLVV